MGGMLYFVANCVLLVKIDVVFQEGANANAVLLGREAGDFQ